MADVRLGIDATGARTGADEFIRQMQRVETAARQAASASGSGSSVGLDRERLRLVTDHAKAVQAQARAQEAQARAAAAATRAQETQTKATQNQSKADEQLNRQRLAQIRAGVAHLRVINDENASYARRVDASLRYAKAMGVEIDTQKLLLGVQHQLVRARSASVQATSVEEIANRSLSRGLRGIRDDFRGLAAVLQILPGNMGILAAQTARLAQGFVLLGPLLGSLAVAAGAFTALAVAGDRTKAIPDHLKSIWAGLKEVATQAGEASGATQILVDLLGQLAGLLPAPQSAIQAVEGRISALKTGGGFGPGAGDLFESPTAGAARGASELQRAAELQRLELELVKLRAAEGSKLRAEIDKEGESLRDLNLKLSDLIDKRDQGIVTEQEYQRLFGILSKDYDDLTGATERQKEATELQAKATKEATEAAKAYHDEIAEFQQLQFEAIAQEQQRIADITLSNDLLEREIAATKQGTLALEAFNVEKARTLELDRQRQSGTPISGSQSDELVKQAERAARLGNDQRRIRDQQRELAKDANSVWDNAIDNIQRGFGDLFTKVLTDGKDAFDDLGGFIKDLFARVIGEIINTEIFGKLFGALKQSGQQVSGAAGGQTAAGGVFGGLGGLTNAVSTGITSGFAKLGGLIGGLFGGVGGAQTGANTGASIGGFATTALENIGAIIAGGFIGSKLIGALKLANDTKLENIALKIGTIIGAIGGGIAGAAIGGPGGAGIGSALGSFGVGSAAVGQAQVIQQLKAGANIFEAPNRAQAINRGVQIGGPIGGIYGAIAYNKLDTNLEIVTRATEALLPSLQGGMKAIESAFGFVGASGSGTGGDLKGGAVQRIIQGIAALDNEIAAHLTRSEIALVAAAGGIQSQYHSNVRDATKVFQQRTAQVLGALNVPSDTIRSLQGGTLAEQADKVTAFLDERKAIVDLVNELRNFGIATTESEKALEEISRTFDRIKLAAPQFGIALEDSVQLKAEAIKRVIKSFNDSISDGILTLTDPASLAANQLAKAQEQRLKEATALGAELVQIERLTLLERQELLKQINDPIKGVIDALRFSTAGQAPTAALSAAEARFSEVVGGIRGGTGAFQRQDLSAAAQTLITLGESLLGGPGFAAQRDTVLSTLESFLLTLPGTAADTGQALSGLTFETARGNAANEQLLQQIADENAAMRAELALLRSQLDRLLNQS